MEYTIAEEFTLPSLGKVYSRPVNPIVKLRSMSTEDEMLRLAHSERPYKSLCDMIDGCIVGDKPGISTYDMCLGDYQYLLHRLRVVTYGANYPVQSICRWCGAINKSTIDLDSIEVHRYDESLLKYINITLPKSGNALKLKLQTPRSVDDITLSVKDFKKKYPEAVDPTLVYTIKSLIETVDGQVYDAIKLENFIRKLPMIDTNFILKNAEQLNKSIGIEPSVSIECKECGVSYDTPFRVTSEFFGPSIDI